MALNLAKHVKESATMNEHHFPLPVPLGHPGEGRRDRGEHHDLKGPYRRAAEEAELLRARLRQGESHAGHLGAGAPEAW